MIRFVVAVLVLMFTATTAYAVTLGQVRVTSYLNQPLEAEIELVGLAPGQHEDLRIRIANQDQFDRLGIGYTPFLADLRFDVVQSSGRWIVRVRSRRPVSEPFLDFPVQMTWPGGRMIRQYTLLLDPLTLPRAATVTRTAKPAPAPRAAPTAAQSQTTGGATYGPVRRGETLWPIAQKLKPSGITTKQMAIALLRANPQAFIDRNINKLRTGAILTIPPLGVIQQLDAAAASREFAEQTKQWRAAVSTSPREVVATPSSGPPPAQADDATARPSETPSEPQVDELSPGDDPDAQLRIIGERPKEPVEDDDAIQQQLLVTMEEIESNRITTTAIESRLAKLEEELSKMQALVDLKDQQITALQSELAARDDGQAGAAGRPKASTDIESVTAPTAVEPVPAEPAPLDAPVEQPAAEAPVAVEAAPVPAAAPPRAPWYEEYLWLIWALLGLIGLVAVGMMIRRQMASQAQSNVPMADLPSAPPPAYAGAREPAREEIKQAERDFRDFAREPAPEIEPAPSAAEPLPEIDESQVDAADKQMEGLTNSALDEMLDGDKHLSLRPQPAIPDVDDQDIAKWVEELGAEIDQLDMVTTPEEHAKPRAKPDTELDEDIPSILTELDDQLAASDPIADSAVGTVNLEPLDEPEQLDALAEMPPQAPTRSNVDDDAFKMSLDLARAYLEIGDSDGARDMLKQALSGAHDPDQRRQIEELLKQV